MHKIELFLVFSRFPHGENRSCKQKRAQNAPDTFVFKNNALLHASDLPPKMSIKKRLTAVFI